MTKLQLKPRATTWDELTPFAQGYLEAAFFTDCDSDNPELEGACFLDLAPATVAQVIADCAAFELANADALAACYQQNLHNGERYRDTQAGHDFWLTRNGHGAGFWDRGLGSEGAKLSDSCCFRKAFSERSAYLGDDGLIHIGEG